MVAARDADAAVRLRRAVVTCPATARARAEDRRRTLSANSIVTPPIGLRDARRITGPPPGGRSSGRCLELPSDADWEFDGGRGSVGDVLPPGRATPGAGLDPGRAR